jgi:outer membrane biosynthesis protein TonB
MKRFFLASIVAMHASAQSQTQIAQPEVSRNCPKDIVTTAKPLLRYPTLLATQQIEGKTLVRILIGDNKRGHALLPSKNLQPHRKIARPKSPF